MSTLNLPYNQIVLNQFSTMGEKHPHFGDNIFSAILCYIFPTNKLEKRIDRAVSSFSNASEQLLTIKGVHAIISEDSEHLSNAFLKDIIEKTNKLIAIQSKCKTTIENLIIENSAYRQSELKQLDSVFEEIIVTLYDTLRIFKKVSKKTPIITSGAALRAVEISQDTLQRKYAR